MAQAEPIKDAMRYIREHGIVRPRELEAISVPRVYLSRLIQQGKIIRLGRGIYSLPDAAVTELHTYAEVAKRAPDAVLCLLSALAFHGITTQNPASVWIALGKGARKPAIALTGAQSCSSHRSVAY